MDKDGYSTYLIGQVRNDSTQNLEFVQAVYTCRDSAGRLTDADSEYVNADVLAPGVTAPFKSFLFSDNASTCDVVADGSVLN